MVAASATSVSALNDRAYRSGRWDEHGSRRLGDLREGRSQPEQTNDGDSQTDCGPRDDGPRSPRQHRLENAAVRGAQRHANAQLLRSLLNGERDDHVQARHRQKDRNTGQEQDESGHQPEAVRQAVQFGAHRPRNDVLLRVHLDDERADRVRDALGLARNAYQQRSSRDRP